MQYHSATSFHLVNFENLYKLREPVGTVEGFDISEFDRAVSEHSLHHADGCIFFLFYQFLVQVKLHSYCSHHLIYATQSFHKLVLMVLSIVVNMW